MLFGRNKDFSAIGQLQFDDDADRRDNGVARLYRIVELEQLLQPGAIHDGCIAIAQNCHYGSDNSHFPTPQIRQTGCNCHTQLQQMLPLDTDWQGKNIVLKDNRDQLI